MATETTAVHADGARCTSKIFGEEGRGGGGVKDGGA